MDIQYLLFLQDLRAATGGVLDGFMELVTKLGETAILTIALALVYWCIDKREGIFLMFSLYSNRVVNGFAKITACVYRPWIRDPRVTPVPAAMADATGYSFPSGHSANATSFWGGLSAEKRLAKPIRILLILLVLLIGFSRNYLGVHTPQDVIVSLILGVITLWVARRVLDMLEEHPERDVWVLAAGVVICALLIVYASVKSYPVDYDAAGNVIVEPSKMAADSYKNAGMGLGFFLGWFVERRFIRFSVEGSLLSRVVRFVVCWFLYILVRDYGAAFVSDALGGGAGKAAGQFLCVFYLVALAPALIRLAGHFLRKARSGAEQSAS